MELQFSVDFIVDKLDGSTSKVTASYTNNTGADITGRALTLTSAAITESDLYDANGIGADFNGLSVTGGTLQNGSGTNVTKG